jgi:hypothetical protein
MNKQSFHPAFYVMMVIYFILAYSTLGWGEKWAATLYPEDHYFENVGVISLFAASAISLYAYMRALKMRDITGSHRIKLFVYSALAMLYFFGAGEELSWGQRIFDIQMSPGLAQGNPQQELNIHNLAIVEQNPYFNADNIFTVFWMGFAVAIPFVSLVWKRFKLFAEMLTPIVHWGIGALFLINYGLAKVANLIFLSVYHNQTIPFPQALQEVKESNSELLFVFLSLLVLWDLHFLIFPKFDLSVLNGPNDGANDLSAKRGSSLAPPARAGVRSTLSRVDPAKT